MNEKGHWADSMYQEGEITQGYYEISKNYPNQESTGLGMDLDNIEIDLFEDKDKQSARALLEEFEKDLALWRDQGVEIVIPHMDERLAKIKAALE